MRGAKRRAKFGLPTPSALFPSLLLAVRQVFLHLLGQFKNPRVALDELYKRSKIHRNRPSGEKVTADFMCTKSLVSVCLFARLFACRVESVQGFRAFFLRLFGNELYHSKAPVTEIMPVVRRFGLVEF